MPRRPGDKDFRPSVITAACRSYLRHASEAEKAWYEEYLSLRLTPGPSPVGKPTALDKAFSDFCKETWPDDSDRAQAQAVDRRVYRGIVRRWLHKFLSAASEMKRTRRPLVRLLSEAQIDRLSELLGTPTWRDGKLKYVMLIPHAFSTSLFQITWWDRE